MIVSAQKFSDLVGELQRIDRGSRDPETALRNQGNAILDAFLRHAGYTRGAVWLRPASNEALQLVARTPDLDGPPSFAGMLPPQILDRFLQPEPFREFSLLFRVAPEPHTLVPLLHHHQQIGIVALGREADEPDELSIEVLRAASSYVTVLLTMQRMADEAREGDFQLKYRLWELESLYDIGLSVASTLDLDELSEEILVRSISLLNARRAALYLKKGARFALHRSFGDVRGEFFDAEIGAVRFEELRTSREPIRLEAGAACLFPGCSTLLALPFGTANELVGILAVADKEQRDGGVGAFDDHDVRLLSQFATQAAIALENARLHRDALAKQAMERELEVAATIQRDILPRSIPRIEGLEIDLLARPARQVGGDYYTFIERDDTFSLCVGDVAGKSVPAAILVSALHAAMQLLFDEGRDLGEIATELNRHIHHWSSDTKFITLILATIDRESGLIRFVNAGHNPGYLVSPDGSMEELKSHGLPIGLMGDSRYSAQTRALTPGTLIVLYSDGITEADDEAGDEYGNERLEAVLRANASRSVGEIRAAIEADLEAFVGEAAQRDDQTLVLVRA
jgi:sigma-B regulation protein RsbU (phosphoserine phosphatase)